MIGIYKITSPLKKIYIGQSINIENRFKGYKKSLKKAQIKLYNSIREASRILNMNRGTLKNYIYGKTKNKTNLIKV
jgi:hypothetical protein